MNNPTPKQDHPTELDGKTLVDMIGGKLPPHEALLQWLSSIDPELAQEIRDEDLPEE